MRIEKFIDNVALEFDKSPMRLKVKEAKANIFDSFEGQFNEIEKEVERIKENVKEPVKVVLMGEVKAGKSTLLNSILEKEVSITDVIESTASIIEVYYSDNEEGSIIKKDGQIISGSFQEINNILNEHHRNLEFFSQCDVIRFGLPLKNLRKVRIVDTPGVATVTAQNSKVAEDYIQNADVILWVFNSNQIGQTDIEEYVENIATKGKKIVGVLNKIDEIDGDISRVIKVMRRSLGIYIDDFFPVSAYLAYKGIEENNIEFYEKSLLKDLLDFIEENVEANPDKVHRQNLVSSLLGVINRECNLHDNVMKDVNVVIDMINDYKEGLSYYNSSIKNELTTEFTNWFENEFLKNEERDIKSNCLEDGEKLNEKFNYYFSDTYIKSIMENKLQQIQDALQTKWIDSINNANLEMNNKIQLYCNENCANINNYSNYEAVSEILIDASKDLIDKSNIMMTNVGTGIKSGLSIGAALSGYFAWLGPGAAHVTIGSALGSLMPPALIAGAAIGGVSYLLSRDKRLKERNELVKQIDMQIEQIKQNLRNNIKIVNENIEENSNKIYEKFLRECTINNIGLDTDYLLTLEKNVKEYINEVKGLGTKLEEEMNANSGVVEINNNDVIADLLN